MAADDDDDDGDDDAAFNTSTAGEGDESFTDEADASGVAELLIRRRLRIPGTMAAARDADDDADDDKGEKLDDAATARLCT